MASLVAVWERIRQRPGMLDAIRAQYRADATAYAIRHGPDARRRQRADADLDDLRQALRADVGNLAEALFGPHNKALSTRNTWRWGSKGSLAVEIRGPRRGLWFNHEGNEGSDPLGMIQYGRRCSFPDALLYARQHTGISDAADDELNDEAQDQRGRQQEADRQARRAERDAAEVAELAAEQSRRIETAQQIAANTVPLVGTLGELYLKQTRGIPPGPDGWPMSIRFHPRYRSLVAIATGADGAVQAVQQVYLTDAGAKVPGTAERPTKRTNGVLKDGAVVRLPGPADGPLQLAEGPETGLAAWSSSAHETWIGLGEISKMVPPAGRRVIVCRDDDARFSPADRKLASMLAEWRRAGVAVVVATPWPVRRHDKSDMADTILHHGCDAVRERIQAALEPVRAPVRRVPLVEAERQVEAAVTSFFTRMDAASVASAAHAKLHGSVVAIKPDIFTHGIRVSTGVGKSAVARHRIAVTLAAMRARGDTRNVVVAVPTHALGDEQADAFTALPAARAAGLTAAIWRGRAAPDPRHPDYSDPLIDRDAKTPMCGDLERVHDAQALGLSAQTAACKRRITAPDGTKMTVACPLFATCSYQKQHALHADLWLVAHDLLFHKKPAAIGKIAALVVDEAAWRKGLIGAEGRPLALSLDALAEDCEPVLLADLRRHLLNAFRVLPDGPVHRDALRDVLRKAQIGVLRNTLLSANDAAWAIKLEYARKIDPLHPGQSRQERRDAMDRAAGNRTIARLAMVWNAVRALLAPGGPDASGWLALATVESQDGPVRVVHLKGRKDISEGFKAPTLLLDALLPIELVRPFWPDVQLVADVEAAMPYMRVRQVTDRAFALSMLEPLDAKAAKVDPKEAARRLNRLRDLRAILVREARRHEPGRMLVVLQKSVEAALHEMGRLPPNIITAHHNAVAGRDEWKDVRALIVVGRTMPPPSGVERIAEALTGCATAAPMGWYERADATREMVDGPTIPAEGDRHTDALAEMIRWQIAEGELLQIIGRPRGVRRTAADPVDILLLTDLPLPVPLAGTLGAADLEPTPDDHMMAAGGMMFENPTDAAAAYPLLWRNGNAAKLALWRARLVTFPYRELLIGECNQPRRVDYQLEGPGRKPAVARFDAVLCPDPETFLTAKLAEIGTLAWCRAEGISPAAASAELAAEPAVQSSQHPISPQTTTDSAPLEASQEMSRSASGTALERALHAMPGGVLPLSAEWLHEHMRSLFPSLRTGQREAAKVNRHGFEKGAPCGHLAVYSMIGQFRPSKALVRPDVADPRAELERVLGRPVTAFRLSVPSAAPSPEPDPPLAAEAAPDPKPPAQPVAPLADASYIVVPAYAAPRGHLVAICPHCRQSHFHLALGHQVAPCRDPVGRGYVLLNAGPMLPWAPSILAGGWAMTADVTLEAWV